MFTTTVISVRVKEEIKKLLEESGLDIGEEIRKYLEELAWKVKIKKMIEKWDAILRDVKPSEAGFSEKSVREDRESH
ncbi:MAG: VapB-type antitoxin [Candidatus Bathyarchaeia archaeon]|nr:VapB-type antitoxin [Candidatus Bathyarchaeota archaeon]